MMAESTSSVDHKLEYVRHSGKTSFQVILDFSNNAVPATGQGHGGPV